MGALTPRSTDQALAELLALLPPGWALPKATDSRLAALLTPQAEGLATIEGSVHALLAEADPRTTAALFEEWERAFGLPDPCAPNWSFSRATVANYWDGAGVLREAAVNEPRYVLDALGQPTSRVLVEPTRQNSITNPNVEGSSPTAFPYDWGIFTSNLGTIAITMTRGVEAGIPYIDMRWNGTPTGAGVTLIWLSAAVPAVLGEQWTLSACTALSGGSMTNIQFVRHQLEALNASAAIVGLSFLDFTPTGAALSTQRRNLTWTTTGAGIATITAKWQLHFSGAGPIDATFRIALPQLEKGGSMTSPILPPAGTRAIATRAEDILTVVSLAERRARLLQRIAGNTGQSKAFFTALATALGETITITEHRPLRFGMAFGLPFNGEDWAHHWTVTAPGSATRRLAFGDRFGAPFQTRGSSPIGCVFDGLKPAHTTLQFIDS